MKVVSVNIGEPKTVEWHGQKVQTGIYKYPVEGSIYLGSEDVKGDYVIDRKHHGGLDKACYAYSADHYNYWKKFYPDMEMPWGMFGENLSVEGLHEAEINIGDIFEIGETVIQATQPRQPCYKLGIRFGTQKINRQFVNSGFPGVYFRMLKSGKVKAEDNLILIEKQNSLSVQKIFELLYTSKFEVEKENFEKAINDPFIAESCKQDLLNRRGNQL